MFFIVGIVVGFTLGTLVGAMMEKQKKKQLPDKSEIIKDIKEQMEKGRERLGKMVK